jgi:ATP-dependent Zn protease
VSTESYSTLRQQIDARQVTVAYVDEETHDVRVTLKSGTQQLIVYPAADHKVLIDSLLHHGVKPIYTKHKHTAKPVHHVLRYIAAGVVVVLLLIGGGVWMYTRGPRKPPQSSDDAARA